LDLGVDGGTAGAAVRAGPVPGDEATVPAQQRGRCHDKRSPTTPFQNLTGGGEEGPIRRLQLGAADLTAKNLDLMAEYHEFDVFGALRPAAQHQQSQDAPQREIHEHPEHHAPPAKSGAAKPDASSFAPRTDERDQN
jgi:hypothetical protein